MDPIIMSVNDHIATQSVFKSALIKVDILIYSRSKQIARYFLGLQIVESISLKKLANWHKMTTSMLTSAVNG